jgi:hypothetical protein
MKTGALCKTMDQNNQTGSNNDSNDLVDEEIAPKSLNFVKERVNFTFFYLEIYIL